MVNKIIFLITTQTIKMATMEGEEMQTRITKKRMKIEKNKKTKKKTRIMNRTRIMNDKEDRAEDRGGK